MCNDCDECDKCDDCDKCDECDECDEYIDNKIIEQLQPMDLNSSSYYRANPFADQGYLPSSAFRNRKPVQFVSQLPQGQHYFDPTGKKHYSNAPYRSQISESEIMHSSNEQKVLSKDYFRSLNVYDIEGASTNTLISQAIKNKLKAQQALREKKEKEISIVHSTAREEERVRLNALQNLRKRREQIDPTKINSVYQPNGPNDNRRHNYLEQSRSQQYYDQAQNIYFKEKEQIMQRQLNQPNYHQISQKIQNQYKSKEIYRKDPQKNETISREQVQRQQSPIYANQYDLDPAVQQQALKKMEQEYKIKQNIDNVERNTAAQMRIPTPKQNIQRELQIEPKSPFGMDRKTPPYAPQGINQYVARQMTPYEQRRLYNPTFLSYGSPTIGLTGRNVVGN